MIPVKYLVTSYSPLLIPFAGYWFGWYLDRTETLRLTKFRDKSALYGRELAPGEPPSWP